MVFVFPSIIPDDIRNKKQQPIPLFFVHRDDDKKGPSFARPKTSALNEVSIIYCTVLSCEKLTRKEFIFSRIRSSHDKTQ